MLVNIANEQAKAGNDVTVIVINKVYEQALAEGFINDVKLINMGRKAHSHNPLFLFKLNKTLRKLNPNVIHLHESLYYGLLFSSKLRRKACATLHGMPCGTLRGGGLLGRIPLWTASRHSGEVSLIDNIPRVFAISRAVHDSLWNEYGVESVVVNNGIISGNFKQRDSRVPNSTFKMVQVSRIRHEKKGQDLLILAVAKLQDAGISVDFIGEGGKDSLEYLQDLTMKLGISDRVHFLGNRSPLYVAEHLRDYDLLIQPSRYEGFGLTVAEAMAAGLPVLVTAGQGSAEVCSNNTYGWTFENGNADSLADRIAYIRDHYVEALDKAKRGRMHVIDCYDVSVTAHKYLEEYKKMGI
ncbi:MAG: glycosyltransferase family 4 protein [Prevotella sp.]|nr:glycosyltransferase family 4 protein [Prevotella sp.]